MTQTDTAPILSVRDLQTLISTKRGDFLAVDGVSFDLHRGETLGIVGESGSGKSMTGMSLMRLLPPRTGQVAAGSITLAGRELTTLSDREMRRVRGRDIAMILQDPQTSLNPAFTIGDQIAEALRLHGKPGQGGYMAMAVDALRKVQVAAPEMRVKAYPHQMSGGMRQRAVGAIAISCQPQVIIADEPTTALDVTVQAQYLRLLRQLQQETGMGILFITHDFGIVARVCHSLAVMYAGQIVESGPVRRIFDRPSHPYTRALLDSVPKLHNQSGRLPAIDGQPPALWAKPPGCRFAPRCGFATDTCRTTPPPLTELGGSGRERHSASCWRLVP
ncbi:ABC transporter ATP-binding protein [Ketogulonicigenium vulgare]|uniref:Oligopeptide/dipeptide ABC transporter, ATPase subunit n=1 Tax=Ketogulonicigenium vulgare (strain WSH-001) TaxID=759362 RepID=F9YAV3_KETVW|nr:ABC transporter ATP-binding protein [Ketogulonicigenium vulgare]ADO43978.1 oligopeptide/dipeptide ABC transporter, ATPase subunit [Ketogulonicigenium vulgare Y25]AEM42505.1 Oligopeptide/dipeptide ABC transporter, ATPase subunit [Ketogulonicigenium vulgare WSH-001]ALJ82544.1 dipeptide/oligopeptide/nickel ABC transporter ATP-binding protein [Ketogulonicigenium vulgare]ANW35318.1 dipeptide/oligopeptide/nickel ABC transporter ATP-binding protein [Ketogulonicigenium vulgare]AOZ53210.1 oligopepti